MKKNSRDIIINDILTVPRLTHSIYKMNTISDERGSLISLETMKNVPFDIKRIFYIFNNTKQHSRGMHAHRNDRQFLFSLTGAVNVHLDDGITKSIIQLNSPDIGLLVENMVWIELHDFSSDCCLVTLSNDIYEESDYIRDYNEFLKENDDAFN